MALNLVVPNPVCSLTSSRFPLHKRSQLSLESPSICKTQVSKTLWFYCNCMTSNTSNSSVTKKKTQPGDQTIVRRSANYKPPVWKYDYLQSLTSTYAGESYEKWAAKLKEDVKMMIEKLVEPLEKLELVDSLQRLGVSHHFEAEIERILESIHIDIDHKMNWRNKGDLYAIALEFRLLRQHRYNVPKEVFSNFKDKFGQFKESLSEDIKGLLSLYESSYLLMEGESILEEARDFATKHLKEYLKKRTDPNLAMLVSHALELPLHWTMPRMEARWFIDAYERRSDMNPTLLEFAKLDFNMVQAIHQEDLKHVSRWWESTRWRERLPFMRDRVMENYLWSLGEAYEPQFQYYRRMETRINILLTCLDDVYDAYGTLDELELFTDAVDRWDVNAVEHLPDYMKICFLGYYNWINEMAYDTLKEHGIHILPYLKRKWQDLIHCYLKEVNWAHSGQIPTMEEYVNHAWTSIAAPVMLTHAYLLSTNPLSNPITQEELDSLENYHDLIKWSSLIVRLYDDLGTSWDEVERGDNPKSIQIYMHETGASAEDARDHVKHLISEAWKKLNEAQLVDSPFNRIFVEIATNLARVSQFIYQHGDGHGHDVGGKNKERASLLLVEPIPFP
ncbi:unnamed protein product [Camellia sinensis]